MQGRVLALLLAVVIPAAASAREALDYEAMVSGRYRSSVDLSAYAPGADAVAPLQQFEGRLRLRGKPSTRTLVANKDYLSSRDLRLARSFPDDFDFEFVQDGDALVPVRRGPVRGKHGWWEFVLEPGKVWEESDDRGFTRAAIPFALTEKNANCTHNGVLMFLFNDSRVLEHAAIQISSETCLYLQFDLWGMLEAEYTPRSVKGADEVISAYRREVAARMPVRPLSTLGEEFASIDVASLATAASGARTLHGLVYKGVNYTSNCPTRHGDYPFCEALVVPSYSVAKSALAGVGLMRMEKRYPGTAREPMSPYVPASGCRSEEWTDVDLLDLLDMSTGHYDSSAYMADEDAAKIVRFFDATDYAHKLAFSCEAYPRAVASGTQWVYHTPDTFLLGVALDNVLEQRTKRAGSDVFRDVIDADIYAPLKLSPTARTSRRTHDSEAQAFFGWGLFLLADDMAKLGRFLGIDHGRVDDEALLDETLLDQAMQRDSDARGLQAAHLEAFRYQHGFWARNLAKELDCAQPTWVPFMSGFGGILVVMFPNDAVWYSIADDGELASINFAKPAVELAKLGGICATR